MAHQRQTIREAVATILATTPTSWASVLQTRIATSRQIWPFLMVYVTDETSEQIMIHPTGIYDRIATINIIGMLKMPGMGNGTSDVETVEDRMDTIAAEIETKLTNTALRAVVAKAKNIMLNSTAMEVVLNDDESVSHAVLTQQWQVRYHTAEGSPETLI